MVMFQQDRGVLLKQGNSHFFIEEGNLNSRKTFHIFFFYMKKISYKNILIRSFLAKKGKKMYTFIKQVPIKGQKE